MATSPNMRFWHVTVFEKSKTVMNQRCLTVQEANTLFKEMKEKYPAPTYIVLKENY